MGGASATSLRSGSLHLSSWQGLRVNYGDDKGVGCRNGLGFVRISTLSRAPSPSISLALHPPLPPRFAIPPPSKICASTSMPVRLTTPVRSLGVAGRLGRRGSGGQKCFGSGWETAVDVVAEVMLDTV